MKQPVTQLFGHLMQRCIGCIAIDHHLDHVSAARVNAHLRLLGLFRKSDNPVYFALDLLAQPVDVFSQKQFHHHAGAAFTRGGGHFFDAFQRANPLLDGQDDPVFHFLRTCAGVYHRNGHRVGCNVGKDFLFGMKQRDETAGQADPQNEAGRHGVVGHPRDGPPVPRLFRPGSHGPTPSASLTSVFPAGTGLDSWPSSRSRSGMPSTGVDSSLMTINSPCSTPCET